MFGKNNFMGHFIRLHESFLLWSYVCGVVSPYRKNESLLASKIIQIFISALKYLNIYSTIMKVVSTGLGNNGFLYMYVQYNLLK